MQIPRADDEVKTAFRDLIPDVPGVEIKAMFGNIGAFVNGNMFAGLFGSMLGVKLTNEADRTDLAAIDGAGPFGPAERPMGGYIALPPDWARQEDFTADWIGRALGQISALPAKIPKSKPPTKTTTT